MPANLEDLVEKISDSTGLAKTLIREVVKEGIKHFLFTLGEVEDHKVRIEGLGVFEQYKPKRRGGVVAPKPGKENIKIKFDTSRTLKDKAGLLGWDEAVTQLWGEEFEYVRGRKIKRRGQS